LPDENLDNGAVRDPNRDIAEDRAGIDDQARIRAVLKSTYRHTGALRFLVHSGIRFLSENPGGE
jgi:hypothetical protein